MWSYIRFLIVVALGMIFFTNYGGSQTSAGTPQGAPTIQGYVLRPNPGNSNTPDLALNKPARQSSMSQWSQTNDAEGAVDGDKSRPFGFHTNQEQNPWWQVDLQGAYALREVRIYNRYDAPGMAERARTITVLLSQDGTTWKEVSTHDGSVFGGDGQPLIVPLRGQPARFVRLQLHENTWFHLREVEITGDTDGVTASTGCSATKIRAMTLKVDCPSQTFYFDGSQGQLAVGIVKPSTPEEWMVVKRVVSGQNGGFSVIDRRRQCVSSSYDLCGAEEAYEACQKNSVHPDLCYIPPACPDSEASVYGCQAPPGPASFDFCGFVTGFCNDDIAGTITSAGGAGGLQGAACVASHVC